MINDVALTERAKKDLRKVPRHIVAKFFVWSDLVEEDGLEAARKIPGVTHHEY